MIAGRPTISSASSASAMVWAMRARGHSSPMPAMAWRNSSRSSALSMASLRAPISSTPYLSSTPRVARVSAVFSPVCPPMVGSSASGRSAAMIFSTMSGVIGST